VLSVEVESHRLRLFPFIVQKLIRASWLTLQIPCCASYLACTGCAAACASTSRPLENRLWIGIVPLPLDDGPGAVRERATL